jgi:hypothetical protein
MAQTTLEKAASTVSAQPAAAPGAAPLRTVALLGYDVKWIDDPKEAQAVAEMLNTVASDRLSAVDDLAVVERVQIDKIMKELELNMTGLTDPAKRIEAGKLLGARFLLTGSGFRLGDEIYVQTKIIDAETGQVKGLIARCPKSTPNAEIIAKACDVLADGLPRKMAELTPQVAPQPSPAELLKERFGRQAFSWLIAAHEEHKGPPIIDPAVQTELEHLLSDAGQKVKSLDKKTAQAVTSGEKKIDAAAQDGTYDLFIVAEGFSEFGKRFNADLVACVARVEIKIIDARTGRVLASGDGEGRATDLAENLAAKQALRKAARQVFMKLSEKLSLATAKPAESPATSAAPAAPKS